MNQSKKTHSLVYLLWLFVFLVGSSVQLFAEEAPIDVKNSLLPTLSNISTEGIKDSIVQEKIQGKIATADSLLKNADSPSIILYSVSLSDILREYGYYSNAINLLETVLEYAVKDTQEVQIKNELFFVYNALGVIYALLKDTRKASSNYLQALYMAEASACDSCISIISNNLGEFYLTQNDYNKAIEVIQRAVSINENLQMKKDLQMNYTNLGAVYYEQKKYDQAEFYYNKALQNIDVLNQNTEAILYLNISLIYRDKHQYKIAEDYLFKTLAIFDKESDNIITHKVYLLLAKIYATQGLPDKAMYNCRKAIGVAKKINQPGKYAETYRTMVDVYKDLGDSTNALNYMLKYDVLNDSLIKADNKETLNKLLSVYEVELLKREKLQLEQRNKINHLKLSRQKILISGALVIILLLIGIFSVISKKLQADKKKNLLQHEKKELLLKHDKERLEQEHEKMEQELYFKNRQLTTQTLTQVANNEFWIKIVKTLDTIRTQIKKEGLAQVVKQITNLESEIKYKSDNYLGEDFKVYFDSVHPAFNDNLTRLFPNLTANDIRLCAFLKMGLSTKEIASLTFREVRSIESARNRLRKKMNLAPDVNIQTYLSEL